MESSASPAFAGAAVRPADAAVLMPQAGDVEQRAHVAAPPNAAAAPATIGAKSRRKQIAVFLSIIISMYGCVTFRDDEEVNRRALEINRT